MIQEERIIRKVTSIGNGAHIFTPKEWIDDEVAIIHIPRIDPKEEIIKIIQPYLDKIIAVFLFGSYARNEQEKDSDIDVFIISSEKFIVKSKNMEVIVIPENKIEIAKKLNPILFYSMVNESIPIINLSYLEKLKKEKIKRSYFKSFIKETEISIDSNKELIEIDKKLKNKDVSESVIYSLILRLRGIILIDSLLDKKKYSKEIFRNFIVKNSGIDYEKVYKIYRSIRDDSKTSEKISIDKAESLLSLLVEETKKISKKIK